MNKNAEPVVRSATDLRSACDDAVSFDVLERTSREVNTTSPRPVRYAIYARVALDVANADGIAEQVRVCQAAAANLKPPLTLAENGIFNDVGKPGNTLERYGLKALIGSAQQQPRPFEHVFMLDTSRLARSVGQVLAITKIFSFHGITLHFVEQCMSSADPSFSLLVCLSEMSDQVSSDLHRAKVRLELSRRIAQDYSPGGKCFGYQSREKVLRIAQSEAATIRRIYSEFASGTSASQIAMNLNARQVPGPRKAKWKSRHVYAVLRRSLYRGRLLWGRTRTVMNFKTGKRIRHQLPPSEVLCVDTPRLRIVDADLASAVDERLASIGREGNRRMKS